jgi:hypothetical protein
MGIIDNAKEIATAVHEIKNLELYERVLNLNAGILEMVEENRKLRIEIEDLNKKLQLQGRMNFKAPFYFQDGDSTPYCSSCWETKTQPIHVVTIWDSEGNIRRDCPTCKNSYVVASTTSRPSPPSHYESSPWG